MITASRLSKHFGLVPVLDEVSLAVEAGEAVALLGPNGAGKTTLLRLLATLLSPSGGSLSLGGIDARREPDRARALVGIVGHGSQVYEDLTAIENLRFWTVMRGGDPTPARLGRALAEVELDTVADERARTLSLGMRRRLALARLVLEAPRVLLLDEPFTALDQAGRKWLGDLLLGMKAAGAALVVATHSFADALGTADRVAILAGGRLVLDRACAGLQQEELRRLYEELTGATPVA